MLLLRFAQLLQPLRGAEASIGMAFLQQSVRMLLVNGKALGLDVGPVRPAAVWPCSSTQRDPHEDMVKLSPL